MPVVMQVGVKEESLRVVYLSGVMRTTLEVLYASGSAASDHCGAFF